MNFLRNHHNSNYEDEIHRMNEIPKRYSALLADFIESIKKTFGDSMVSAILFGSVAKGKARNDSDIDVCLIFKSLPKSRHKRTLLIFPVIKQLRETESYRILYNDGYFPEVSPILYTIDEIQNTKPIFLDIIEDGIILTDDGTFTRKKEEIKKRMEILGTHKVRLENGDYYWILKPGLRLSEEVSI